MYNNILFNDHMDLIHKKYSKRLELIKRNN